MASQLLNTDISGTLKLNKLKLPTGVFRHGDGAVVEWSSGSDGSTITQGYIRSTIDGSIVINNNYLRWSAVFVDNVSDDLATYYIPKRLGQYTPESTVSTSTTTGIDFSGTYTIESSGNCWIFGSSSATVVGMPMTGATQYVSITVPVGHEVLVDFTIAASDIIRRNGTAIYSCYMPTSYSSIYAYLSTTSSLVSPTSSYVVSMNSLKIPMRTISSTSSGEVTTQLNYKNTTSASKTIYARIVGVGGVPISSIKLNSTDPNYTTNGSLTLKFKTGLSVELKKSAISTPDTPESFPAGKPLNIIGTNGNVFIDTLGNMTLDLPSVYYVKRGNYHLKIDSTGVGTSSDGMAWLSK